MLRWSPVLERERVGTGEALLNLIGVSFNIVKKGTPQTKTHEEQEEPKNEWRKKQRKDRRKQ